MPALDEADKAWHAKWLEACKELGEREYRWPGAMDAQRTKRRTAYGGWPHPLDSQYFGAPESAVERLPTHAQRAVELTREIHALLHEWGVDTHDVKGGFPSLRRRGGSYSVSSRSSPRSGTPARARVAWSCTRQSASDTPRIKPARWIFWSILSTGTSINSAMSSERQARHRVLCCEDTIQCAASLWRHRRADRLGDGRGQPEFPRCCGRG